MTKNKTTPPTPERHPLFVTKQAHTALPHLCEILAEEGKVRGYTYIDAASNAILNEYRRAMRRQERRTQRKAVTA